MHSLARGLQNLQSFFEVHDMASVNKTILLMVLYCGGKEDWMRGISRFENLPRVSPTPLPHIVPLVFERDREIARRAKWIIENLDRGWRLSKDGFEFESENEALHYRLMFSPA